MSLDNRGVAWYFTAMNPLVDVLLNTPAMFAALFFLVVCFLRLGRPGAVWGLFGGILMLGYSVVVPVFWYLISPRLWETMDPEFLMPIANAGFSLWLAISLGLIAVGYWPRRDPIARQPYA